MDPILLPVWDGLHKVAIVSLFPETPEVARTDIRVRSDKMVTCNRKIPLNGSSLSLLVLKTYLIRSCFLVHVIE